MATVIEWRWTCPRCGRDLTRADIGAHLDWHDERSEAAIAWGCLAVLIAVGIALVAVIAWRLTHP